MALQEGFFYRTCAMYPPEVSKESPCKSMTALTESPIHGRPIRVTEDTTMWTIPRMKVGKPHSYYLARFDPTTSVGVIFLGTRTPSYSHRFVRVHGGIKQDPSGMLRTVPPAAFNEVFYLNLSHPLRVQLIHVPPPTNLNSLRKLQFGLGAVVGPPPVGITDYVNIVPRLLVSLDEVSTDTFWKLHKAYHVARPTRRTSLGPVRAAGGGAWGGGAAGGGAAGGGAWGGGAAGGGAAGGGAWGGGAAGGGATGGGAASGGAVGGGAVGGGAAGGGTTGGGAGGGASPTDEGATEDAPWGRIGILRIGIDICCIVNDGSDDENDEDDDVLLENDGSDDKIVEDNDVLLELGQYPFGLDGTLVVSDFPFGLDDTTGIVQSVGVL